MKLCACLLADNIYKDNFLIETPKNKPESIIEGRPEFKYNMLKIDREQDKVSTGQILKLSTEVTNMGATGIADVELYIDGKVAETKKFPVIHNNTRTVTFDVVFHEPGKHEVAIGTTPYRTVNVGGRSLQFLYTGLSISAPAIPVGEEIIINASVKNVGKHKHSGDVSLHINEKIVDSKSITLLAGKSDKVTFLTKPEKGICKTSIGSASPLTVEVYPHHPVDIGISEFYTHCSTTAKPCEFSIDKVKNHYTITAGGTDFLHAEDSYGAIYLKRAIRGNFVATLKVMKFGENVNPWYRAGIFLRNNIGKSHDIKPGSLGSVLLYATPKLSGIQWDEFGDGCMHKGGDRHVYERENPFPVWLKLVRHDDSFTGYTSYDGLIWENPMYTGLVPGLGDAMDIGMAAGTIDQVPSPVVLEDFLLEVEDED